MDIPNRSIEGRDLAKHFNCKFIETSAKQRINVDEAFINLVREIRKYNKVRCAVFGDFRNGLNHHYRNNKLVAQDSKAAHLAPPAPSTTPTCMTKVLAVAAAAVWSFKPSPTFIPTPTPCMHSLSSLLASSSTLLCFFPLLFVHVLYYSLPWLWFPLTLSVVSFVAPRIG